MSADNPGFRVGLLLASLLVRLLGVAVPDLFRGLLGALHSCPEVSPHLSFRYREAAGQWASVLCEPQHPHHTMGRPSHTGVGNTPARLNCLLWLARWSPSAPLSLLAGGPGLGAPPPRCPACSRRGLETGQDGPSKEGGREGMRPNHYLGTLPSHGQDDPGAGTAPRLGDEVHKRAGTILCGPQHPHHHLQRPPPWI